MNYLKLRIVSRNDTSSNWENTNPILLTGEIGVENDTAKIKIGDGVATWTELPYASGGASLIVVENFGELPKVGQNDKLYKVSSTQTLYIWNTLANVYMPLGQGGGDSDPGEQGYKITF